ncbi:endonuclease MutS2 [candidate division KSB3 bacterium]|uniref:Endonuclease MutS2 n=1 Tax=candidate division KSB3 bacterium TaxID=2044937 RepID=A0A2G6KH20_9BACT|nr:MAG: endonuclease MutS2 [candidate division KSB3 bacterium]
MIQDQVITLRQNRFVIPIKASSRGKVKGIVHDQSSSGVTVFIEPIETVELNNRIASLEAEEKQEIRRVLLELTTLVRTYRFDIEETIVGLGELDFINGKTKLSERWQCQQPNITDRRAFNLLKARHPLLLLQHEHDRDQVVPTTIHLDEDTSTLLITGPNTGGKTVSLKTVGLLMLMVQAGLHIPVEKDSEVCVFDAIFADIGDMQSIEQNLSTFSSHIQHIVKVLEKADERSLVLLDELGAGTDPAEGASLGIAILEYLDGVKAKCMATTHHDALKSYAYTHPRTINACVEFDVNTLSPTYHLLFGVPGKSNAFIIAERLGLPEHIIQRAHSLMDEDVLRVDQLIRKLTSDSEEMERKKAEIESRHRGVLRLEKETDRLLLEAEKERQAILDRALEESKKIVDRAIKQSQDVLRTLPAKNREQGREQVKTLHREAADIRKKLNKAQRSQKAARSSPSQKQKIAVGAKVRITDFGQIGSVLQLSKDGKQAEIQVGMMRLELPVQQLSLVQKAEVSSRPKVSVADRSGNPADTQHVPVELVIVGKRVDDALDLVNSYLDQAFLSGLPSVGIVHGIGTGTLKKAVSGFLQTHPHVVKYAVDSQNYGMTNVELVQK